MTTRYRIGELAALSGRSAHTIRWYEAQGLIPGVERDAGGRRRFHPDHVSWLELVTRLRSTGMSIAQMRQYTRLVLQGRASLAQRRTLLAEHRERVHERIAEWQEALQLIDAKVGFYERWIRSGQRPDKLPSRAPPKGGRGPA